MSLSQSKKNLISNTSLVDIAHALLDQRQHYYSLQTRQQEYAEKVNIFEAKNKKITHCYGGAMGGGKTYVCLALFIELALYYPDSVWTVIRESRQRCKDTVWKDIKKMGKGLYSHVNETSLTVYFENGSVIEFKGENKDSDPDLDSFKSYATNGFFFEQIEEVSKDMWDMAVVRTGRNVIDPMPPQILLASINPSNTWVKDEIYEKWREGNLPEEVTYTPALISDNKYLYDDEAYMSGFGNLDSITKRRYLDGDWTAFAVKNRYAHAYNKQKHVSQVAEYNPNHFVYLTFDFNVNPFVCEVRQHGTDIDGKPYIYVVDEISQEDSNIYKMAKEIREKFANNVYNRTIEISGDPTGRNRNIYDRDNRNAFEILIDELALGKGYLRIPKVTSNSEDRILFNSILENHPNFKINPKCKNLIRDLEFVRVDIYGNVIKRNRKDATQQVDAIDALKYSFNAYNYDFIQRK